MKFRVASILLILLILFLASMACVGGGGEEEGVSINTKSTMSANATATFGAEQFHLQLTAISNQDQ